MGGGIVSEQHPLLILSAHLLIFLRALLIPLSNFPSNELLWSAGGHALPLRWDQAKSGLSYSGTHMPREAQWGRSGCLNEAY